MLTQPLRIGNLVIPAPVMLAPMAGISSWPMRLLCRRHGAPLAFTEMVSAAAVARGRMQADALHALKTHPHDRPLGIQIFGADPAEMARAAHSLAGLEADLIDINMGCPARKIIRSGAGAALMLDLERARAIIREARKAVELPLTVKMRLGWDESSKNAAELAKICQGEGVDAVIVHGRTWRQGFAGDPDLEGIREVVAAVSIPVIGNGGIMSAADAERMIELTGCAGVMAARGARGNPWLFEAIRGGGDSPAARPSHEEKARAVFQHLEWTLEMMPARQAALEMRKHLSWFSKGIPAAVEFRRELHRLDSPEAIRELVERYFLEPTTPAGGEGRSHDSETL